MLIQKYQASRHKILNNDDLTSIIQAPLTASFKGIHFPTTPLDVFDHFTAQQINDLFATQLQAAKEEIQIFSKYGFITQPQADITETQYKNIFFYNKHAYLKKDIIEYITNLNKQSTTYVNDTGTTTDSTDSNDTVYSRVNTDNNLHHEDIPTNQEKQTVSRKPQIQIDRQAIRNITGYSFTPTPRWSTIPIYIKWQHELLEDDTKEIVVNGSRQMGKSYTVSEKIIENSFLPNRDALVGAFQKSTTNIIRDNILKLTRKFPDGTFVYYKKESYILNTKSLTKTYFRTLDDNASNVLGLTLTLIVVDEAQLISKTVFEDALMPTMATTDGQLIMIGTPGFQRKGYMYEKMMAMKRDTTNPRYKLYQVDYSNNPLISPSLREHIMNNLDDQSIRRQYCCEWGGGDEGLFVPNLIQDYAPPTHKHNNLILGIDPARKQDRSGYSLHEAYGGKITTFLSGFVPDSHKKDWNHQASFFLSLITRYKQLYDSIYVVIDESGVGDGVATIFQNAGININARMRYTSGLVESEQYPTFKVPKSILLNTTLDFIQEGIHEVYEPSNQLLIEEMSYITTAETRTGQIAMESLFFDDITNSMLIALYYCAKKRLHLKNTITDPNALDPFHPIENPRGYHTPNYQYQGYTSEVW